MPRGSSRIVRDGRELLSRAELARVTGEREHTLYRWWTGRAHNGHPDAEVIDGQPYFDLGEWTAWRSEHGAERRIIDGRPHVTAAEIVRTTGEPLINLDTWYRKRDSNGHPHAVKIGRQRYFDEAAWRRWYEQHKADRQRGLTEVDRRGDPNELIATAEAARVLGYTNPRTLTSYIARGQFIEPDEEIEDESGRIARRWTRRRVWKFADQRTWSRRRGGRHSS